MKYNMVEFAESIRRFTLVFAYFVRLIFEFIERQFKITSHEPAKISASPKDTYIELQKNKFILTFQDSSERWNSNVDAIMKDPAQLSELLKDGNNELEKKWRSRILIENTPRGNVIMFYDLYKHAFSYYCDQAVMPYDVMNAVAMKYVMTFHCRDLFVDSNVLPSSPVSSEEEEKPQREEEKSNPNMVKLDKQAFAKFKTYNNATKKAGISPEKDKTINCFLNLGASRNWLPITKKVKPNPLNGFQTDLIPSSKKLSYLDYKKISK